MRQLPMRLIPLRLTHLMTPGSRPLRLALRAALWVCVLAVAWLAFAPLTEPAGFSWDKGNHVLAFFVMAALADGGYPGRERAPARWGLLLGYGLVIELVQQQLPFREFSWLDFAADGIGILLYLLARGLLRRIRRQTRPGG